MTSMRFVHTIFGITVVLSAVLLANVAAASTYSIKCNYSTSVAANIPLKGTAVQTEISSNEKFELSFVVESTASFGFLQGNNGAAKVRVVWGDEKVTFIETTDSGTVQVTTIYGKETGTLASVHSRASGGKGYEMPSQLRTPVQYSTTEAARLSGCWPE